MFRFSRGELHPPATEVLTLQELVRKYSDLFKDSTRVMLRIKAIFRARAILMRGVSVFKKGTEAQWLYEEIGKRLRSAAMLSPDETGWKIGGSRAWLPAAATREDSFYLITRGRGTTEACPDTTNPSTTERAAPTKTIRAR